MTEFRDGFLRGVSTAGSSPADLLRDRVDLMIAFSSWDSRSVAVTAADVLTAEESVLVLFDVRDQQGLRDSHDRQLEEYLTRQARVTRILRGNSTELADVWSQLFVTIGELRQRLGRPIRLFVDLSACPRYYALAILANALGRGIASSICLFYSEGLYDDRHGDAERHEIFTSGRWSSVPVPGLVARWAPGKSRFYLASVGFEGAKTLRAVARADPDRVAVLLPDPGVRPDYAKRTRAMNDELFQQFQISDHCVVRAPAGDAIRAWQALSEAGLERPEEENSFYICSGTKPHSVALALRAMAHGSATVLYNLPDAHKVNDVKPSGIYWSFIIEDLSALPL
jgi:hypothetical protein